MGSGPPMCFWGRQHEECGAQAGVYLYVIPQAPSTYFLKIYLYACMFALMSVCAPCVCSSYRGQKSTGSPGTGFTDGCEPPRG